MAKTAIRLDRTKPFSTCHGERTTDDPHYRVHFFQSYKVGKKLVSLPFDSNGALVEDARDEPYKGLVEGKEVMFQPLYSKEMRGLVAKLEARAPEEDEEEDEDDEPVVAGSDDPQQAGNAVDLTAWLRGKIKLSMTQIRVAMNAQKGMNPANHREAIMSLVLDEKMIPLDELDPDLRVKLGKVVSE